MTDVFHPMTTFEHFLDTGSLKKSLSSIYQILLAQDKMMDWTRRAWEIDWDSEINNDQWRMISL